MLIVDELFSNIKVISNSNNKPVTIFGSSKELRCIGVGTDAAVFQYVHNPALAYKVYAEDKRRKIEAEKCVYEKLKASAYFPTYYKATDRYLVISFENGITLYDCLLRGIPIPKQAIEDVEDARKFAREKGLNPRDIHFKNVLLQNGRGKVIDVSEYMEEGNDHRWEHLKKAFDEFYHMIEGKAIPSWVVETIQKWYNQKQYDSIDEFMKEVFKLKMFHKLNMFN